MKNKNLAILNKQGILYCLKEASEKKFGHYLNWKMDKDGNCISSSLINDDCDFGYRVFSKAYVKATYDWNSSTDEKIIYTFELVVSSLDFNIIYKEMYFKFYNDPKKLKERDLTFVYYTKDRVWQYMGYYSKEAKNI